MLYATFLAKVYRDSFNSALPDIMQVSDKLIDATVGGELFSSLLAVSLRYGRFLLQYAYSSGQGKRYAKGSYSDSCKQIHAGAELLHGNPYFNAHGMPDCNRSLLYISCREPAGYMSGSDVAFILLDVFLLVLFGTALSSIINVFLTSQGQISAVGTIVSAGYGFICGAYMPISQFGDGLQKRVLSFLPGTYGTSLLRNHALNGVFGEMSEAGFPDEVIDGIKDSVDCNLYFFDDKGCNRHNVYNPCSKRYGAYRNIYYDKCFKKR